MQRREFFTLLGSVVATWPLLRKRKRLIECGTSRGSVSATRARPPPV